MPRPSDEKLVAYLDGELEARERDEIAARLEHDPEVRLRVQRLSESAALLRAAFDEVLREPLPDRLIAAAHGETRSGKVLRFAGRVRRNMVERRRWWIGVPVAASLMGLVVGAGLGYFAGDEQGSTAATEAEAQIASQSWLDSIAGYHKLFVNAGPDDVSLADVPANAGDARKGAQKLPQDFRLPNLKPWGLEFQGARFLIVEGRPATQLFYTTDNKQLGPLTLVVGQTQKPDLAPTFDHRDDLNLLYWRHKGHLYALVGTANIGYLWNIANDIGWQLDAI
jgi:anti-sigma factor RsiW